MSEVTSAVRMVKGPNYQGKRRRSTEGAEGTNTGHEDGEAMASVGVRLTAQLGAGLTAQRLDTALIASDPLVVLVCDARARVRACCTLR